jgi:putative tricarboxylic transport membrane protein
VSRIDVFAGLLLAAGFSAMLWVASSFQYGTEFAPGPGFAPIWYGAIGLVLSLLVAGDALRTMRRSEQPTNDGVNVLGRAGLARVGATLLGLVVMLGIIPWLGLTLSILVFLLFLTLGVQRLSLPVGVGASLGTALFVYLVFVLFLGVPAPAGPLGF